MDMAQVRAWAIEQGYPVGARGRLSLEVRQAYAEEHGGDVPAEDEGPLPPWSCRCGRRWSGLAQAHCSTCHAHFSTAANFDKHRAGGDCTDPATMVDILKPSVNHLGVTWVGAGDSPYSTHTAEAGT